MYPPAREVVAEVFTTMPQRFRNPQQTPWTRSTRPGMALDSFLEGPSFDREGNLYCVDIPFGRIFKISPSGEWSLVVQYEGLPNGLKIHKDARIFVADATHGIMILDPATNTITPHLTHSAAGPLKGCNDLVFSSNGDLYFTDPGPSSLSSPVGDIYRVGIDGKPDLLLGGIPYPNGLVLNPEETHLAFAVTDANAIWRTSLRSAAASMFIQLSGGLSGPDGLAVDEEGSIAIAHAQHGTVWLFSKAGEPMLRIRSQAGSWITNVAYGGPQRRTLYITEAQSASILAIDLPVAGKKMFSHV